MWSRTWGAKPVGLGGLGELGLALGWVQEPVLELQGGFGDSQGGLSCTRAS